MQRPKNKGKIDIYEQNYFAYNICNLRTHEDEFKFQKILEMGRGIYFKESARLGVGESW